MRERTSDPKYDYSSVGYARRHAIRTLDEYECSTDEIVAMFGCSQATFHRYDLDVRLTCRPARPARWHPMSPEDAREIAIIALTRAGYSVASIAKAINVSLATVYREQTAFHDRRGAASPAELRHIRRNLKMNIVDNRSLHQRRIDAHVVAACAGARITRQVQQLIDQSSPCRPVPPRLPSLCHHRLLQAATPSSGAGWTGSCSAVSLRDRGVSRTSALRLRRSWASEPMWWGDGVSSRDSWASRSNFRMNVKITLI